MLKVKESKNASRVAMKPFRHKGITILSCAELKICLGVEVRKGNNRKPFCHPILFATRKRHLVEVRSLRGSVYTYGRNRRSVPTGDVWIPPMRSEEDYVNYDAGSLTLNLVALGFDRDAVRSVLALTEKSKERSP